MCTIHMSCKYYSYALLMPTKENSEYANTYRYYRMG